MNILKLLLFAIEQISLPGNPAHETLNPEIRFLLVVILTIIGPSRNVCSKGISHKFVFGSYPNAE